MGNEKYFDFGENWVQFSEIALTDESFDSAITSIQTLVGIKSLENLSFLDVGCGSGLFSIAAQKLNASKVVGIDINPVCINVSKENSERYLPNPTIKFVNGSALDNALLRKLGVFDVVYAWGSLHHTGSMWDAIMEVSKRVNTDGLYVFSIYNKHFTSPIWKGVKRLYNLMPSFTKQIMLSFFGVLIFIAKFLVTGRNPFEKERGMNFRFDVIDWVGGYPYEYATPKELMDYMDKLNFDLITYIPAKVPTGCNEFVFRKRNI